MTDTPDAARARLGQLVFDFFDRADRLIRARRESDRRYAEEWQQEWSAAQQEAFDADVAAGRDPYAGLADFCADLSPDDQRKLNQIKRRVGARVTKEVCGEFGISNLHDPPRLEIKAAAGLGKTRAIIAEIMRRPAWWNRNIWIFVPTIDLAEELKALFGAGPNVQVVRGRNARNPLDSNSDDPTAMCQKPEAADRAGKLGLNVMKTVCANGTTRCRFYDDCAYLKQSNKSAGVRIFAHEYLHLQKPGYLPSPDLVIVDESAVSALISKTSFGVDRLTAPPEWFDGPTVAQEVEAILKNVRSALESGEPLLAAVRSPVTLKQLRFAAKALSAQRLDAPVTPDLDEAEAIKRLEGLKKSEALKIAKMLRQLAHEYNIDRAEAHSVELRKNAEVNVNGRRERQARVYVHARRKPIIAQRTPLLLIDADADQEINTRLFGGSIRHEIIKVERSAFVTQCHSERFGKTRLRKDQKLLNEVRAVIRREASEAKTLVVCNLQVRRLITGETQKETEKTAPISAEWEGATISHFGRIKGVDGWKDYARVIIIGAEQPRPEDVEGVARAIWSDDPERLLVPSQYRTDAGGYRLRSGVWKAKAIKFYLHPDSRVQRVLELTREHGSTQAIDRIRLVHAQQPKKVLILCNIPLDITVDDLEHWSRIRDGGSRTERAYERSDGAVPLVPKLLVKLFPDLYSSESAAKHDIARTFERSKSLYSSYRNMGLSKFRPIRSGRGGSRKWSKAAVAADTAEIRAQVEAAYGCELEWAAPPTGTVFDPAKCGMIAKWQPTGVPKPIELKRKARRKRTTNRRPGRPRRRKRLARRGKSSSA